MASGSGRRIRMRTFLLLASAIALIAAGSLTIAAGHPLLGPAAHDAELYAWAAGGPSPLGGRAIAGGTPSIVVYLGTTLVLLSALGTRFSSPHQ